MPTSLIKQLHDQRNQKMEQLHSDLQSKKITDREYALEAHRILHAHNVAFGEVMASTTVLVPKDVMAVVQNLKEAMAMPRSPETDYAISLNREVISERVIEILLLK